MHQTGLFINGVRTNSASPEASIELQMYESHDESSSLVQADYAKLSVKEKCAAQSIEFIEDFVFPEKRFCEICQLTQPFRTKHCRDCNKCVRKFDHHCFWVGGCVGELNHRLFLIFLGIKSVCLSLMFNNASLAYLHWSDISNKDTIHIVYIWGIMMILSGAFCIFTIILFLYHTYLVSTN